MGWHVMIDIGDALLRESVESALQQSFPDVVIGADAQDNAVACDLAITDRSEALENCQDPGVCLLLLETGKTAPPTLATKRNLFVQPFRLGQLLDRVRAIATSSVSIPEEKEIAWGDYTLNLQENLLSNHATGAQTRMTEKERNILYLLYKKKGAVIDRQELLDKLWGYAEGVETHTLETHIYRLRQKIEEDPSKPLLLLTEGNGYRFNFS